MAQQLTFDLPVRVARDRSDYFVSSGNQLAIELLDTDWPQSRMIICGPKACGKSHLAAIWASDHDATIHLASDVAQLLAQWLKDWPGPIVIEDIHLIAGNLAAEEAVFHLLNAQAAKRTGLLITCEQAPVHVSWTLKDLGSRLQGIANGYLPSPDDALLAAVMVKQMADRQLDVAPDVIGYLLTRVERSFDAVARLVASLDHAALTQKRAITKPFSQRVLDKLEKTEEK